MLDVYKKRLQELQTFYDKKTGEAEQIVKDRQQLEEQLKHAKERLDQLVLEKTLIEKSCEQARTDGKQALENLVNYCLNEIFDDNTNVSLTMGIKDGLPVLDVEIKVTQDGEEVTILPELDGGGINDIISTAIFAGLGILNMEENRSIYVLDEPSKYISKGIYSETFAEYLKELLNQLNKQVVISTHDEHLSEIGAKTFYLEKSDETGITHVTEVEKS